MDRRAIRRVSRWLGLGHDLAVHRDRRSRQHRAFALLTICVLVAAVSLTTFHILQGTSGPGSRGSAAGWPQDALRTGWDPDEPRLSPAVVRGPAFGQLFSTILDGPVLAQPVVAGGTLVVATENDRVYGLDAATGAVRWSDALGSPVPNSQLICATLGPASGISSTPVYDPGTGLVYAVAETGGGPSGEQPQFYLFAIRAQTGAIAWKVVISGTPMDDPAQPFHPAGQLQRPGLLLLGGRVYAAFGARCEGTNSYSGYVVGVNTVTRARTIWTDETGVENGGGGIWQSGSGLMSDGPGRIFLAVGNGVSPTVGPGARPPGHLGDSVVRLGAGLSGSLTARDFFSPASSPQLDTYDTDLGSGGPAGLPFGTRRFPHLLAEAGKDGQLLVLNRDALGGRETGPGHTDAVVTESGPFASMYGRPAAFDGEGGADYLYYTGASDYLRALLFNGHRPRPVLQDVANSTATFGYASGSPVVTSAGRDPGSAVLWQINKNGASGTLEAFDAIPQRVSGVLEMKQIWSAPISVPSNFSTPATGNGRVYVATRSGQVLGFGTTYRTPLTTAAADLGQVATGSAARVGVIVTARAPVTITSIITASATGENPFTAGASRRNQVAVSLPVTLSRGQRLTVPVTFSPVTPGGAAGWVIFITDRQQFPTVSVSLSGDGTQAGLSIPPAAGSFLPTFTGTHRTNVVDITNSGLTSETVSSVNPPRAPFSAVGLPAVGTVLRPGESISVVVTYSPAAAGAAGSAFTITTARGTRVTEDLSGTASVGHAVLTTAPSRLAFGRVPVGRSSTRVLDISDPGDLPVTITGVAPPAAPFHPLAITAGQSLGPGEGLAVPITFTPLAAGAATSTYRVRFAPSDGRPERTITVTVTGTGTGGPAPSSP